MMIEEFEQRTGYFPSSAEYKAIEAAYMEFDGDKDEFCKAYKKNANGIAERITKHDIYDLVTVARIIREEAPAWQH